MVKNKDAHPDTSDGFRKEVSAALKVLDGSGRGVPEQPLGIVDKTTKEFELGENPGEVGEHITVPHTTRLASLLQIMSTLDIDDGERTRCVDLKQTEDGVPFELMEKDTDVDIVSAASAKEGEQLAREIALEIREVVTGAVKIEATDNGHLQEEVAACFDEVVNHFAGEVDENKRGILISNLDLIRQTSSEVLGNVVPQDPDAYIKVVRNLAAFVVNGVMRNNLSQQVTLQIPAQ